MSTLAELIRDAILDDVTDRRGWRQEWDGFDDEVQEDIKREWLEKITERLETSLGPQPRPATDRERIEFVRGAAIALRAARCRNTPDLLEMDPGLDVTAALALWDALQKAGC